MSAPVLTVTVPGTGSSFASSPTGGIGFKSDFSGGRAIRWQWGGGIDVNYNAAICGTTTGTTV